jgi:hypothetical protein
MADKVILEAEVKSNVGEVTKDVEKLDDATKDTSGSFGKLSNAVKGVGTALKAAGIGIVVAAIAKMFDVLSRNQKIIDAFNITMQGVSLAFNDLFKYLDENITVIQGYLKALFTDPLGELYKLGQGIQRYFIDNLMGVVTLIKSVGTLLANVTNPAKFIKSLTEVSAAAAAASKDMSTVFDEITNSVTNYTKGIIDTAKSMVELDKAAALAVATNQKILEQKDREAEIQRQIRDDTTKSFDERIAANEKLNDVLDEQEKLMLANAKIIKDAAQAQKDANDNDENKIALIQAEAEELAILAQIEGFRSEQKTNAIALTEEQKAVNLENAEAQLAAYSSLANALSGLAGDNKELAAAGAIIDTYAGANKAFAQGGVAGFVSGAAIIAAGLANVRKIYDTPVGGSGGSAGASPQTPAPQMMSGAFELTGGQPTQALRAYVLTDEMTDSQNQLANIRRRATI